MAIILSPSKLVTILSTCTALLIPVDAYSFCKLGTQALKILNNYPNYTTSILPATNKNDFMANAILWYGRSSDMTSGAIFALSWKNHYNFNRNLLGMISNTDYHNNEMKKYGLNSVWMIKPYDDLSIAKIKASAAFEFHRVSRRNILNQDQIQKIMSIPEVNETIGENTILKLLVRAKIEAKRAGDKYYYLNSAEKTLRKQHPELRTDFRLGTFTEAFESDHPRSEYEKDYDALLLLLRMRDEKGITYFENAAYGKISKEEYERITDRPNLRDYFSGVCSDISE